MAEALMEKGYTIATGGTDNHIVMVDLRSKYPASAVREAQCWEQSVPQLHPHA